MTDNFNQLPIVSVILPSYNHEEFIEEAIGSVIDQDYKGEIEIIIIDDCSIDNTLKILEKYKLISIKNRKLIIISKDENKGVNDSVVRGLECSSGEYIQLFSSDDLLLPQKLSLQVNHLIESGCDGVCSDAYSLLDNKLHKIDISEFKKAYKNGKAYEFLCGKDFGGPLLQSGIFSKTLLMRLLYLRKSFKSDDWAFALEAFKNYNICFLDEYVLKYRLHNDNSYRKYLATFPMRVEVISKLVPIDIQDKSYSNIFYSQSKYLLRDNITKLGVKFLFSSFIFYPSFSNFKEIVKLLIPTKLKTFVKRFIYQ
jgi:alpha-1,3-rhamnosyltransferase